MSKPEGLLARLGKALRPPKTEATLARPTNLGLTVFDQYDLEREKQAQTLLTQEYWLAPKYGMGRWSRGQLTEIRQCARTGFGSTCIDAIVDRVASMDWDIVAIDPEKHNDQHIKAVKDFFDNPNSNEESFVTILRAITRGTLETDDGCLEKVFDRYENQTIQVGNDKLTVSIPAKSAKLKEIFAVDGSSFYKITDAHGYLSGYWQVVNFAKATYFDKRQIVYMIANPIPGSVYGRSPFMAVVEELELLVKARRFNVALFNNLALPGLHVDYPDQKDEDFLKRVKGELAQKYAAEGGRFEPFVSSGGVRVDALSFNPQQLQAIELQQLIQKIVMAKLKVTPAMLGFTEDVNRATAASQRREFRDRTLFPLLRLIEYHLNTQVVSEFGYDDVEFKFISEPDIDDELTRAQINDHYLKTQVLTPNEVREGMGLEPVDWGDYPYTPPAPAGFGAKTVKSATPRIVDSWAKEQKELIAEFKDRLGKEDLTKLKREILELFATIAKEKLTEAGQEGYGKELPAAQEQRINQAADAAVRDFERILNDVVMEHETGTTR